MEGLSKKISSLVEHDETGLILGKSLRPILIKSSIQTKTLRQIWTIVDLQKSGKISEDQLIQILRLISVAQNNEPITEDRAFDANVPPPKFSGLDPEPDEPVLTAASSASSAGSSSTHTSSTHTPAVAAASAPASSTASALAAIASIATTLVTITSSPGKVDSELATKSKTAGSTTHEFEVGDRELAELSTEVHRKGKELDGGGATGELAEPDTDPLRDAAREEDDAKGSPTKAEPKRKLKYKDFVPTEFKKGGFFVRNTERFEPLAVVLARAQEWIDDMESNPVLKKKFKVINIQTMFVGYNEYELFKDHSYAESTSGQVQIVRVFYHQL